MTRGVGAVLGRGPGRSAVRLRLPEAKRPGCVGKGLGGGNGVSSCEGWGSTMPGSHLGSNLGETLAGCFPRADRLHRAEGQRRPG